VRDTFVSVCGRNNFTLLEGFHASAARPSDKSSIKTDFDLLMSAEVLI
jgi:hypothetical protein